MWAIPTEKNGKKFGHPAMFPEALADRILRLFSFRGDAILDPFNGAGTTTKVAKKTGRNYLGIDIDKGYCETAQKRVDETEVVDFVFDNTKVVIDEEKLKKLNKTK